MIIGSSWIFPRDSVRSHVQEIMHSFNSEKGHHSSLPNQDSHTRVQKPQSLLNPLFQPLHALARAWPSPKRLAPFSWIGFASASRPPSAWFICARWISLITLLETDPYRPQRLTPSREGGARRSRSLRSPLLGTPSWWRRRRTCTSRPTCPKIRNFLEHLGPVPQASMTAYISTSCS